MLGRPLRPSAVLGVGLRAAGLLGAGRHQHADGSNARFGGRRFASSHSVQTSNVGLPGGNFLCGHVAAGVFSEVIATHEPPVAHGTHELLLPGVGAPVAGELVGAGEPLIASVPAAAEGLLTCVCAEVSLEVRALEVRLPAAGEVAHIVSPAGKVHLCGRGAAALPRRYVDRRRGQRQQLGVAQRHDSLGAVRRLGHRGLRQDQHHRALRHRRAHDEGLLDGGRAARGRLGQDGCGGAGPNS